MPTKTGFAPQPLPQSPGTRLALWDSPDCVAVLAHSSWRMFRRNNRWHIAFNIPPHRQKRKTYPLKKSSIASLLIR